MNTVQYKCPNCGAELTFDPEHQNFNCEYCDTSYTEAEMQQLYQNMEQQGNQNADAAAETLESENDDKAFENETRLYTCQNCGAQIIAEAETSATFCYYCHAPVVLAGRLTGEYKPAYVLPFAVTRDAAVKKFHDWCKKRWFLPRSFTSEKQLEKVPIPTKRSVEQFFLLVFEGADKLALAMVGNGLIYTEHFLESLKGYMESVVALLSQQPDATLAQLRAYYEKKQ